MGTLRYISNTKTPGGMDSGTYNPASIANRGTSLYGRAIDELGDVTQRISIDMYNVKTAADVAEGRTMVEAAKHKYYAERGSDPETWEASWNQVRSDFTKEVNKLQFTPIAKKAISKYVNEYYAKEAIEIQADARREKFKIHHQRLWDKMFLAMSQGDMETAESVRQSLIELGHDRLETIEAGWERYKGMAKSSQEKQAEELYYNHLTTGDYTKEEALRMAKSEIPIEVIGDRRNALASRIENWFAQKEEERKKEVERIELDVVEGIRNNDPETLKMIDTIPDADKQWTWQTRYIAESKRLKEIENDPVEESRLQTLITDIWRNRITPQQFRDEVVESRYPSDGSKPKIDDNIMTSLITKANTELKSHQQQVIDLLARNAKAELNAITDPAMWQLFLDGFETAKEKQHANADNQTRIRQVNRYVDSLYDFLATHPDAQRSEFEDYHRVMWPSYQSWIPGQPLPVSEKKEAKLIPVQIGRVAGADEYVTRIENERQYSSDEKEWLSNQLSALNDVWYTLDEATKLDSINIIMDSSHISNIGQQIRAEIERKR